MVLVVSISLGFCASKMIGFLLFKKINLIIEYYLQKNILFCTHYLGDENAQV